MFVFRKKLWLDNFVLRLTDLYLSYSVTNLGKNDFKNSILDGNPKFGTILLTLDNFRSNVLESNEMWLVVFIYPTQSGKSIKSIANVYRQTTDKLTFISVNSTVR